MAELDFSYYRVDLMMCLHKFLFLTDSKGHLNVWDCTERTDNDRYKVTTDKSGQPMGNKIKDIAWSFDSQRMVVGGEGSPQYV